MNTYNYNQFIYELAFEINTYVYLEYCTGNLMTSLKSNYEKNAIGNSIHV